ncbi:MAG: hypothetical protein IPK01_18010 [Acidobacteria bacterium]|nr:hypothetical protein [Acidobacteriota bacterium]
MNTNEATSQVVDINSEQAFTPDPLYKLMGIFEDSNAGVAAADELKSSAFDPHDIELFCGVPGAETYDFHGDEHGLIAKMLRSFRNITFDRVIMDRYEKALNEGHCVLMVHIHKTERKDAAAAIMHRHGAVQVDYFGLAVTTAIPANENSSEDKYEPDPLNTI